MQEGSCVFLSKPGYNPKGVLVGSGVIIPLAHRTSPFELTAKEVVDMFKLLKKVKHYLDEKYQPDGYSLGWNVGKVSGQAIAHVHLHVMPRYNDEPLAGKGIRFFLKQENNKRQSAAR